MPCAAKGPTASMAVISTRLVEHYGIWRRWIPDGQRSEPLLLQHDQSRAQRGRRLHHLPVGAQRSGNWIPLGAGETFSIWLRFYNPSAALREHLATMELPRIVREDGTHANAQ